MISYDINGDASSFKVVSPPFECVMDGHELFIMNIIIGLGIFKHSGVECDQMVVTVCGADRWYCC